MGWKSTKQITREEAISAIIKTLNRRDYNDMTNTELEDFMESLGIGEDTDLAYFGYNFNITDNE